MPGRAATPVPPLHSSSAHTLCCCNHLAPTLVLLALPRQEFKSKSPEELGEAAVAPLLPFDALPFPFPTELYLPMVGLLIEAPLMLKGRRWQEMLHINLGMVQRVQVGAG